MTVDCPGRGELLWVSAAAPATQIGELGGNMNREGRGLNAGGSFSKDYNLRHCSRTSNP